MSQIVCTLTVYNPSERSKTL